MHRSDCANCHTLNVTLFMSLFIICSERVEAHDMLGLAVVHTVFLLWPMYRLGHAEDDLFVL